jgi:hypothetical protein
MPHRLTDIDRRTLRYGVAVTDQGEEVESLPPVRFVLGRGTRKPATGWATTPVVDGAVAITVAGVNAGEGEGVKYPRGTYSLWMQAASDTSTITEPVDTIVFE